MIEKKEVFVAVCDYCGKESDTFGAVVNAYQALKHITEERGWIRKEKGLMCVSCQPSSEYDKLKEAWG